MSSTRIQPGLCMNSTVPFGLYVLVMDIVPFLRLKIFFNVCCDIIYVSVFVLFWTPCWTVLKKIHLLHPPLSEN